MGIYDRNQSHSGSHTRMFYVQAVVLQTLNDRLSALFITLLIPSLMHPDVHPWV